MISSRVIGKDIQSIRETNVSNPTLLAHENKKTYRELELAEGRLVGITVYGTWDLLPELYARVLDQGTLTEEELKNFKSQGELTLKIKEPEKDEEEIICNCMYVSKGTIKGCIKQGCTSVEEISNQTGAGTICGCCLPTIEGMLGHAAWQPMHLTRVDQFTPDIRSYRLFPVRKGPLSPFKVGQHVVIQCEIDGNWIERSYTLTSTPKNANYYEIAIKREEKGLLSRWLFENEENVPFIRVSNPSGLFMFDIDKPSLVVCIVAGIGVTPAIALGRTILDHQLKKPLHIHVSAHEHKQLSYAKELEGLTQQSPQIRCTLHLSRENKRLSADEVDQIARENPTADFFICGPKPFEEMVKSSLQNAGIKPQNILIETFTHSGGPVN